MPRTRAILVLTALVSAIALLSAANATQGRGVIVAIADGQFIPAQLTIAVGTSVTWNNQDQRDHSIVADDGSFSSGNLKPGRSFSHRFETPGSFGYRCALHPRERGVVVVREP